MLIRTASRPASLVGSPSTICVSWLGTIPATQSNHHRSPSCERSTARQSSPTGTPPYGTRAILSISLNTSFGRTRLANGINHAPIVQPPRHRRPIGPRPSRAFDVLCVQPITRMPDTIRKSNASAVQLAHTSSTSSSDPNSASDNCPERFWSSDAYRNPKNEASRRQLG